MLKPTKRTIVWFSCGAASAVAAKLVLPSYEDVILVYCDTLASESQDNYRFMRDVEQWLQVPVTIISSKKYRDIDEVFEKTRYMAGISGARCTVEMKKVPRFEFQRPDDTHVFGYTAGEEKRAIRFEKNNHDLNVRWPLIHHGYTKQMCFDVLKEAGIELPQMYKQGYRNNNCIGCVKATSIKYWTMIRRDYPEVFARRSRQSRELGVRLTRLKGERIFIDEIPIDQNPKQGELENISCGPECAQEEEDAI